MEAEKVEEVCEQEIADPGFVLDDSSGLYYHASSGFFHDSTAGWYYNTHDGLYYKFEKGMYTLFSSLDSVNDAIGTGGEADCGQEQPVVDPNMAQELVESGLCQMLFPLWHYDSGRCMYWYYDKESEAYHLYDKKYGSDEQGCGSNGSLPESPAEDELQPASKWIEETLIEMYLRGYDKLSTTGDGELNVGLADSAGIEHLCDFANGGNTRNEVKRPVGCSESSPHDYDVEANAEALSDDEGSESLEEGEWVPEEGECVSSRGYWEEMDEFGEQEGGRKRLEEDVCACRDSEGEHEEGEWIADDCQEDSVRDRDVPNLLALSGKSSGEAALSTADALPELQIEAETTAQEQLEEQWQTQFEQAFSTSRKKIHVPGAIDLWDWMTVAKQRKGNKQIYTVRLVGRIASSRSMLHPSLSASGGLIKTGKICGTEYDFVKVSSGKVYRLQRPSSKHLASVTTYDSSNPTWNWGFPKLGLSPRPDKKPSENAGCEPEEVPAHSNQVVSKPFIPNLSHRQFQELASTMKTIRPAAGSLRILTHTEIAKQDERNQKYRDRAAERRSLHKGFGIGPGQKGLPEHEIEKLEAELSTEMLGALETAAKAPPLGKDNKGKRMLQGMGWKEGQPLGASNEGLLNPIQASGNIGRTGLGWN